MKRRLAMTAGMAGLLALGGTARANVLYFAMPVNYDQQETDTVFVYGPSGTAGIISSPGGFSMPFTVGSNSVASVVIPSSYDLTASGVVTNSGFSVVTTDPNANVGASYLSREPFTTDTTYLLNSTALGTSYYAVAATNSIGYPSQVSIVGTANNTTVTVTPTVALASGQAAGTPFNITLNAGQAVLLADNGTVGADLTGSQITSSAPIAVFGGNQCVDVPSSSTACDHTLTAIPSTNNYTSRAVIASTPGTEAPSSNLLRILAATNGTVVTYQGVVVATLNAGQYVDIRTTTGGLLTSSSPVLLTEYLTGQSEHPGTPGDPAETYVPGTTQWLNDYVFSTPVGSQAYTDNFLDLSIPDSDLNALLLNGLAVPAGDCTALTGTGAGYDTCEIAIMAGAGEISAPDPFLLLIDGGTTYDSYFTFAGTTFSTGASPPPTPTPPTPTPPSPVPEPASLLLVAASLSALGLMRRRRT